MIHTGIIGGASAITGIMGGLTGLAQNAPKIEKGKNRGKKPAGKARPKPEAEQADRNPNQTEKKGDTK
ncbi:hypothetical protein GN303_04290 [Commensalibacter melissae]|uniref:Uncharacterized protein n=1 Tax=Commensalibacter melissae TaxID=2070537 RepID=A0A318MV81_9PROT|nr:hypothetical protein [Commensalibacter melissae]PXY98511.1 hypothetical protein DK869_08745 [Commensalibacter melissae]QGT68519.1 hypothetical protein GN303_04290 [Commensalibacter melissae]